MYKQDLALNNLQWLIYNKTKQTCGRENSIQKKKKFMLLNLLHY